MKKPAIQNSIKLIDFKVNNVQYSVKNIFNEDINELNVNVGFSVGFNEYIKNQYSVEFEVEIGNISKEFTLFCKSIAIFETQNEIDENFKQSNFVHLNSPAIAFPFIRSFINTITSNSGIKPVILPSFNFTKAK